jgi:hypothetical protein
VIKYRIVYEFAGFLHPSAFAFGDEVEEKRERRRWGGLKLIFLKPSFSPA